MIGSWPEKKSPAKQASELRGEVRLLRYQLRKALDEISLLKEQISQLKADNPFELY